MALPALWGGGGVLESNNLISVGGEVLTWENIPLRHCSHLPPQAAESGLVMDGGAPRSPSASPHFPTIRELQSLGPSGQTQSPLCLTISSPTCTQPQGPLTQGVAGEKSFHFKSPCFCFPGQTQEISHSADLAGWDLTLFSGGLKPLFSLWFVLWTSVV